MPDQTATAVQEMSTEANQLKETGNSQFKAGQFEEAIKSYKRCLKAEGCDKDIRLAALKNLAAAHLKLGHNEKAITAATEALDICPQDVKALFRRSQAYDAMEKYGDAFKDALKVQHLEPQNSLIEPHLRKLNEKMQELAKKNASTSNKLAQMIKYLKDPALDEEKRETAVNNLLVLAKDNAGARMMIESDCFQLLRETIMENNTITIKLAAIRVLSELCRNSVERVKKMLDAYNGIDFLLTILERHNSEEIITAVQYTIQMAIGALSGYDLKEGKAVDKELMKQNQTEIDLIMDMLVKRSSSRVMNAQGRDAIIELIMRNTDYDVLGWGRKLLESGGLKHLLEVAGELEDVKYESSMNITCNTRAHVSLALERVYGCMDHDKVCEQYREVVHGYVQELLKSPDIESKVRATNIITALLHGPLEIGNHCLSQQGIVEMMLVMAGCDDDELQQRVAAEAIIAAASKKDKCTSIVSMGTNVLKKLYKSPNEAIKVRALVGLCKLGSVGGTDASIRPFSDGSIDKLLGACKKFLLSPKSKDLRKWAAEGIAYLTLDADVKEEVVNDTNVIIALVELAKSGDLSCLYGVITTFVNLTNSYEKNEVLPEMLELAKFAKQHIPEEHVKDKKEFVEKRIRLLAKANVASALVALSKTESRSARELICRVFNAICEHKDFRGSVVQVGGAKVLLQMSLDNNSAPGRLQAAQALARIGITINPEVAFPGQRAAEVVRPLMNLLHYECNALQNFEALMALTNLAQTSESVAKRILKDGGFGKIEHYMYENHEMLRRAATQCTVNLIMQPEVVQAFEGENDRVKLLVCLCEEEDFETAMAAAGGLAMLTGVSQKTCEKVFSAKRWYEILMMLASSKDKNLQHRGVAIVKNLICSTKEIAEKIVETSLFEVLLAITRPEVDDVSETVKDLARQSLAKAQELNLIKSNQEGSDDLNEEDPD